MAVTVTASRPHAEVAFPHHRDNHRVPAAVRASALGDQDGTMLGVEVFHDDTRTRALADRLDNAER